MPRVKSPWLGACHEPLAASHQFYLNKRPLFADTANDQNDELVLLDEDDMADPDDEMPAMNQ